jgi:hypothetical protein
MKRFYLLTRDLHLYIGLFISPFVLLFSVSVLFLVHANIPGTSRKPSVRTVSDISLPENIGSLNGRPQLDAIRSVLDRVGVAGEVDFIRELPKEQRLVIPVIVPGRQTTVELNLESRTAVITEKYTGTWDAAVYLHKIPGPHNVEIRMNWPSLRPWKWLADATVYLLLFITISGVYLWTVLRAERRMGLALLAGGAFSFVGMVYALSH